MDENEDISQLPETESTENIGKKVKFPGLDVEFEIRPELECASPNAIRLAATRADCEKYMAEGFNYPEGSHGGYFCNVCGVELWLAPTGQRLEAIGGAFTCMYCVMKIVKDQKDGGN